MMHLHPVTGHIRRNWHRHLALFATAAAVALFAAGYGAAVSIAHGGYHPAKLPPRISLSGAPVPASWSLAPYLVRIHNQGSSNSCTGQTASTIMEIDHKEATGQNLAFSAGYVWNQATGYTNQGASYDAVFGILQNQGDAPLAAFPEDGASGWSVRPSTLAISAAWPHRVTSWRSISPSDRYTIEAEIHAGRPVAVAIPVFDTFYNQFGDTAAPHLAQDTGSFHFWHSMTGIAYSPFGLELINSWGPAYGLRGRAWISWNLLASYYYGGWHAQVVVSQPLERTSNGVLSTQVGRPAFHLKKWNSWRKIHHKPLIRYKRAGNGHGGSRPLLTGPRVWNDPRARVPRWKALGGVVKRHYFRRRHPFTKWSFQGGSIYVWKHGKSGSGPSAKIVHHKWKP